MQRTDMKPQPHLLLAASHLPKSFFLFPHLVFIFVGRGSLFFTIYCKVEKLYTVDGIMSRNTLDHHLQLFLMKNNSNSNPVYYCEIGLDEFRHTINAGRGPQQPTS